MKPNSRPLPDRATRPLSLRVRSTLFLLPAWFSPTSSLRVAFHRARGVRISHDVEIGYFVLIDNLYPELVTIEAGATVSAMSAILAHDEAKAYALGETQEVRPVVIGAGAFVGVQSVILPGVTVGANAIIGAGSVVTSNVPSDVIVAGVPARPAAR